jgi:hypothetical protein
VLKVVFLLVSLFSTELFAQLAAGLVLEVSVALYEVHASRPGHWSHIPVKVDALAPILQNK